MKNTTTYNPHQAHMAAVRMHAIEAGARDGRFRQRSVKSKKVYSRSKAKKGDRHDA